VEYNLTFTISVIGDASENVCETSMEASSTRKRYESEIETKVGLLANYLPAPDMLKVKVKVRITVNGTPISQLQEVTCHMGSHSVTCHPTQVNGPPP